MTVTADDQHTLTGAYALDALDDNERRMFEEHLETCADCPAEVAEFAATAAYLGTAVAVQPPPQLRDRVLTQIRRSASCRRSRATSCRCGRVPPAFQPAGAADPRRPGNRPGVVAYQSDQRADELAAEAQQRQEQVDALAAEAQRIADVLAAPDAQRTVGEVRDGGAAAAVASEELGEVVLLTRDLPALAEDLTYQLWFIDAEGPVSGGVLDVPPDGDLTLVTEGDLEGVTTIALSVEPSGGSEQPTDVVFGGELS